MCTFVFENWKKKEIGISRKWEVCGKLMGAPVATR